MHRHGKKIADTMNIKKKKLQAIGWAVLALLVLWGTYYMISVSSKIKYDKLSALTHGERSTGTIISQKYIPSVRNDEPDTYVVKYTFPLSSGQEVIGYYDFENSIPSGWNVGDKQVIAYDPQNPHVNIPASADYEYESGEYLFAAILASLVFGGLAFFFGFMAWKSWKLSKPAKSFSQFH